MAYFWGGNSEVSDEDKKFQARRDMLLNPPSKENNNMAYYNQSAGYIDNRDNVSEISDPEIQWLRPNARVKNPRGQVERQEYPFMGDNQVTRYAPFGNDFTPTYQQRIVGSIVIPQEIGPNKNSNGVHGNYAPPPQYEPRNKRLADKPNRIDPRLQSGYQNSQTDKNSFHDDAYSVTSSTSSVSSKSTLKEDDYDPHIFGKHTNALRRPDSKEQVMNRYALLPDDQKYKAKNISSTIFEPEVGSEKSGTPQSFKIGQIDRVHQRDVTYKDSQPRGDETIDLIRYELMKYLPICKLIPDERVILTKDQERKLRKLVAHDLAQIIPPEKLNPAILEDVYKDLLDDDDKDRVKGWCPHESLNLKLYKHKIKLDPDLVRLIVARSVSPDHPGKANYEKVTSFLNLCLKERRRSIDSEDPAIPDEPATPDGNNERPKLVKLLAHQIQNSFYEVDLSNLVRDFMSKAPSDNDLLTEDDMKHITFKNHLPISQSLFESLLNNCDEKIQSPCRFNWRRFASIVHRAIPMSQNSQEIRSDNRRILPGRDRSDDRMQREAHHEFMTQPHNRYDDNSPRRLEDAVERRDYFEHRGHGPQQRQGSPPGQRNYDMSPNGQRRNDERQGGHIMPQGHQGDARRQQILEKLRREEMELQAKRDSLNKESESYSPWFTRYMQLAKHLYDQDKGLKKTGLLNRSDVKSSTMRYNKSQSLDLSEDLIDKCLDANQKGLDVEIHRYLNQLCDEKNKRSRVRLN